jgi:glyoxylase-like metal-dependent hydrolase (beta-lactamase superfamily II)
MNPEINRRRFVSAGLALAAAPALLPLFPGAAAASPKLGPALPRVWRLPFGDFELTIISDSEAFIDGPYPIIGANATEAEVRDLMRRNLVQETRYQPGFSPAILNTGKHTILFDTGNGANGFIPRPNGGWLAGELKSAGFDPGDIDIVVLSHGHPDHVGGMMENGAPLFPKARYVIAAAEYDYWAPEGKHSGELEKLAAVFRANAVPFAERFSFIKPGDEVAPGVHALDAAGHTPGHLVFIVESGSQRMLFWNDCAHHHVASLARPDWHCVFDIDKEQAAATRKRIYSLAATDRLPVFGYHMPYPSLGFVEPREGSGYRWIAHSFQLNPG